MLVEAIAHRAADVEQRVAAKPCMRGGGNDGTVVDRRANKAFNEEPVALVQEAGSPHWWTRPTPLPLNIHRHTCLEDVDLGRYQAVLWITHRPVGEALWQTLHERLVVYRPPQPVGTSTTTTEAAA